MVLGAGAWADSRQDRKPVHREPAETPVCTNTSLRCSYMEAQPPIVEMTDWTRRQTGKKMMSLTADWDNRDNTKKCISEEGDAVPGEWSEGERG